MGCFLLSSFFCSSMAPITNPDASTSSLNGSVSTGCASTGSVVTLLFSWSNASCCLVSQCHSASFCVSSFSGRARCAKPQIKGL
jgi:hypothetical protein